MYGIKHLDKQNMEASLVRMIWEKQYHKHPLWASGNLMLDYPVEQTENQEKDIYSN